MNCPVCGSGDVHVSVVATEKARPRHGILYWLFIAWWLHPILWLTATIPMLVWRLINPNRKTVTVAHCVCVCMDCGHRWER